MLFDVLAAVRDVTGIAEVRVLTPDAEVAAAVRQRCPGVGVLREPDCGSLNRALEFAVQTLEPQRVSRLLIVPADLPMVRARDVETILAAADGVPVAIAHDKSGRGTNLLLLSPPSVIRMHFGEHSLADHVNEARRRDLPYRVFATPSVLWDLDRPRDLHVLLAQGAHTQTGQELLRLRVAERMQARHGPGTTSETHAIPDSPCAPRDGSASRGRER